MTKQELAKVYLKKLYALFEELLKVEKESTLEEREQVYAHNQTRIHRIITNYDRAFEKLES